MRGLKPVSGIILGLGVMVLVGWGVYRYGEKPRILEGREVVGGIEPPILEEVKAQVGSGVEKEQELVEVILVGDVMLGRSVYTRALKYQNSRWPFEEVREDLQRADITLGNLENPITQECRPTDEGMIFCAGKEMVEGLVASGFDGMSLANNHTLNHGLTGLTQTVEILKEKQITGMLENEVHIFEAGQRRLGVIVADDVSKPVNEEDLRKAVERAVSEADVVITMLHWGNEYQAMPSERQRQLGKWLIEAGADVVVGAHPHWVQPVEHYQNGLIFYSLGNFVFDQMWSEETREGGMLKLSLGDAEEIEYEWIPTKIFDFGQVRRDDGEKRSNLPVVQ